MTGPEHHTDGQDSLTLPLGNPLFSLLLWVVVVLETLLTNFFDRFKHNLFDLQEPIFDITFGGNWVDDSGERHMLSFLRVHSVNFLLFVEFQFGDTLETLLKMGLHSKGLLGFREDFKQLVRGQEVESWEESSLGFKIVVKTLLNFFKVSVGRVQDFSDVVPLHDSKGSLGIVNSGHQSSPGSINTLELGSFLWHLVHDIVRGEDWLQVKPHRLHLEPHFQVFLGLQEHSLPLLDFLLKEISEWRTFHGLGLNDVVIKLSSDELDSFSIKNKGLSPVLGVEVKRLPISSHLLEGSLDRVLLSGRVRNIF